MRPSVGEGILDVACFPLVPFSNRIAGGRFTWAGRDVALEPNFPAVDPHNPIHGSGWLDEWTVLEAGERKVRLEHRYAAGEWPWPYRAELFYTLGDKGLLAQISLTNESLETMPAGLGFHPFFPMDRTTRYLGLHRGEWQSDDSALPLALDLRDEPIDWWQGRAVTTRAVDTLYTGRAGALDIFWPDRRLALRIDPSDNLAATCVYVPTDSDWFCVEPVSHLTDALNRPGAPDPMASLPPGETMTAAVRLRAFTPA